MCFFPTTQQIANQRWVYTLTVGSWDFSQARLTECNKALSAARDEWQQALAMRQIRPVRKGGRDLYGDWGGGIISKLEAEWGAS